VREVRWIKEVDESPSPFFLNHCVSFLPAELMFHEFKKSFGHHHGQRPRISLGHSHGLVLLVSKLFISFRGKFVVILI
jgi:hypothetical protein